MSLTSRQIKFLRGLTHKLQPVVTVGDKGLSENVMAEIETALDFHELIKIKLRTDREKRRKMSELIIERCRAEKVHSIGQVACFYRKNPEKQVVKLPS